MYFRANGAGIFFHGITTTVTVLETEKMRSIAIRVPSQRQTSHFTGKNVHILCFSH